MLYAFTNSATNLSVLLLFFQLVLTNDDFVFLADCDSPTPEELGASEAQGVARPPQRRAPHRHGRQDGHPR